MKNFKQATEDVAQMKEVISQLEHDAHLTTMIYHYGKAAFDRGHTWKEVKKVKRHEFNHYWVRRRYDRYNWNWPAVLCEWTKNGWVNLGHGHLDPAIATQATVEVWTH